jgi:hypothetical protein
VRQNQGHCVAAALALTALCAAQVGGWAWRRGRAGTLQHRQLSARLCLPQRPSACFSLSLCLSLSLSVSLRLRLPASIYGVGLMVEGEAVGQGGLVFARLPSSLSYGMAAWPVRKVPLRRTPIKVAYQPDMRVYIVVRRLVA